jgi:hypothetical protein
MRIEFRRTPAACLAALLAITPPAVAQNRWQTDCHRLRLLTATELPGGTEQSFSFEGPCTLSQGPEGNLQVVAQIHLRVEAIWTPATGQLHETAASDGDQYRGYVVMKLQCDRNPLLARAECTRLEYSNNTGWRGFDDFKYRARPITMGRVSPDSLLAMLGPDPARGDRSSERPGIGSTPDSQSVSSEPGAEPGPDTLKVEIPMVAGARFPLEDQRILGTGETDSELRWTLLGRDSVTVIRRYPSGVRMLKNGRNEIFIDWGGVVLLLGKARGQRLNLPAALRSPSPRN